MGWSCRADAAQVAEKWTQACVAQTGQSNVFEWQGRKFFWEASRTEHADGAITGSIWRFLDADHCRRAGGFPNRRRRAREPRAVLLAGGGMKPADFIDDIPESSARAAHQWTSHVPEQRAAQERDEYAATLARDHATLAALADTDDKRKNLEEHFAWYRAKYRERFTAWLAARSRCASTMITGGSGFNVRGNEKANASTDNRMRELTEFRTRALATIRKILRPESGPIRLEDADAADRIDDKLAKLEAKQALMKAANAAIRAHAKTGTEAQVAALVALGLPELAAHKLLLPDFAGRIGFAGYELTNNAANIRRLKGRAVAVERVQAEPAAVTEGANARIEDVPAENRVRLFFPGKPEASVRQTLKSRGFRWAPSIGCWQAHRNPGSLATANAVAVIEEAAT